jgi:hypothetical protein
VVDGDGHLTISAGSIVVEGQVGIAINDHGCPECASGERMRSPSRRAPSATRRSGSPAPRSART